MPSLQQGVQNFRSQVWPQHAEHFAQLADSQAPHTLWITCSDSRIDPSLVTQTLPGDLFMLRNIGNIVPQHGRDDASASVIEYAVAILGVSQIVVCGHSGCGAMQGLLAPESVAAFPALTRWLAHASVSSDVCQTFDKNERLGRVIHNNARQQLANLRTHPAVVVAEAKGRLTLRAWVYDIASGAIDEVAPNQRPVG